jgi:hypothetical protein
MSELAEGIEQIKFRIIKDYLVLGLPMMDCNPGAVSEVWDLLESYSYQVRYQVYDDWFCKTVWKAHLGQPHSSIALQSLRIPSPNQGFLEKFDQRQRI